MTEYKTPEILVDADSEDVMSRMVEGMPIDIDVSEGSVAYDLLHPTAEEVERLKQFDLDYLFQQIWPQFAEGEALDYHGEARGLTRKPASPASGTLTVYGSPGAVIQVGDLFATEGVGITESVSYESNGEYVIPEEGEIDISVTCTEAGIEGNCAPEKIVIPEDTDDNVTDCKNMAAFTNGTEEEEDDDYRQRILDFDQARSTSYAGTMADYRRWANEVPGVGSVKVVPPEDDSGVITIVITDSSGQPASEVLRNNVYDYIMKPNDPYNRLAPINAIIDVQAPSLLNLSIAAVLELKDTSIEDVEAAFTTAMQSYFATAMSDGEIRYQKVANILGDVNGVYDFTDFTINDGTVNVYIDADKIPALYELDFTEAE